MVVSAIVTNRTGVVCGASTMAAVKRCCFTTNETRSALIHPLYPLSCTQEAQEYWAPGVASVVDVQEATLVVRDGWLLQAPHPHYPHTEGCGQVVDVMTGVVYDVAGGCCRPHGCKISSGPVAVGEPVPIPPALAYRDGPEVVLVGMHSHSVSYYHFFFELLPRLALSLPLLGPPSEYTTFVGGHSERTNAPAENGYDVKLMTTLGVLPGSAAFRNDGLLRFAVIPPKSEVASKSPGHLAQLLHKNASHDKAWLHRCRVRANRKIVIQYRQSTRVVVNLPGIVRRLRATYPNVTWEERSEHTLSQFTPAGHFEADCGACALVGGHGAGMGNMLYMPKGSTIVEIIRKDQGGAVYGSLAKQLGHTYNSSPAQHISGGNRGHYANVTADEAEFLQLMASVTTACLNRRVS